MKRRSAVGSWSLLTFLDLITCGLGASLLLLLITSTSQPAMPRHDPDRTILLTAHAADPTTPAAEVGLRLRPLGETHWTPLDTEAAFYGSLLEPATGGVLAFAVLTNLRDGVYEVQPYLRDHPPTSGADGSAPRVAITALGQSARIAEFGEPVDLSWPGLRGQSVRLVVSRLNR